MSTYRLIATEILNDVEKILSPSGTRWYEAHFAFVKGKWVVDWSARCL
jgi:hypothetical protein